MGYRKTPLSVHTDIAQTTGDEFMVAASRDLEDWRAVMALPLAADFTEDQLRSGEPVDFIPSGGRHAKWNIDGRIVKRRDLPKISKTYAWESRNFGRADTSTRFISRMIYQSELIHGRRMHLSAQVSPKGDGFIVFVRCEFLFDRSTDPNSHDVLMAASLVRDTLGGSPRAVSPSLTREEWEESLIVTWSFLPAGTDTADSIYDFVHDRVVPHASARSRIDRTVMVERIEMIQSTQPGQIVLGTSGPEHYIGFKYRDDLVALENFTYGNALYVMYDEWKDLSRKSRLELLSGTMEGFDRIIHAGVWRDKFRNLLTARNHDSMSTKPGEAGR